MATRGERVQTIAGLVKPRTSREGTLVEAASLNATASQGVSCWQVLPAIRRHTMAAAVVAALVALLGRLRRIAQRSVTEKEIENETGKRIEKETENETEIEESATPRT